MNRLLLVSVVAITAGSPLFSQPPAAQILPPAKRAKQVQITEGPALESAKDTSAIIRWTSNNPGGTDDHFGVVHYGTDPKKLSETAKSPIRLNRGHPNTVFRVRVDGLKSKTTYYYTVDSTNADGSSDGVTSKVKTFVTK
ncbi:MAG: Purple acid Phosphatase, N-terminal domain [Verrucomicrobiota bacterium]|jgi:phosphodiesterase/alkaline phosphatase D-like protein